MAVVSVDFEKFIIGKVLGIEPVLNMHMLMRESDRWVSMVVTG